MKRKKTGGGFAALLYTLKMANRAGWWRLWKAMSSKNACKTCALGMGGQLGGMRNEIGHWPEVCKKSFQAMVADMQDGLTSEFFRRYGFLQMQTFSPRELETAGRIVQPLYAGPNDPNYRVITWDEAIQKIVDKLKAHHADEGFFYFSGRSSNEAGFLLQLFARLYGTNNVNNCSYYCHQASGVGLTSSLGTGTATVKLEDVEHADLFFLIGGNPASNHPRLMRSLMNVRRSGGQVVVVNPVVETGLVNFSVPSDPWSLFFGTKIASHYIQPNIGGDYAFMAGIAKSILANHQHDPKYIEQATEGFADFEKFIQATSWEEIVRGSGVDRETIEKIAAVYAKAEKVVFGWTMGITHHLHGVANVRMIVNLALLRGMAGKEAAGLLPLRGHSNVQGIGSMGVTPTLKKALFERLEQNYGVKLPTKQGMDTLACLDEAEKGNARFAICLGGNLFGATPDAKYAERAINAIDMVVYMNTTLNTGHAWGRGKETLILPVLARDEEPQSTTQESMFNYVRLSDGGIARHPGPKAESAVIAAVADGVLGKTTPIDWREMENHDAIRRSIAKIVPGYEKIAEIGETKQEFQVSGRVFDKPVFPTPSGKAQFFTGPIPPPNEDPNKLRMMTVRSEGQFNTVVYEDQDIYRGQERRDVILMAQEDIDRLGFKIDQRVTVQNETGRMPGMLVREFPIRPGNALMYCPEANILVPKSADPHSRTPAFKSVLIEVVAEKEGVVREPGFVSSMELAGTR